MKKYWKEIAIGLFLGFAGCEQAVSPVNTTEVSTDEQKEQQQIGIKLENPYTVEAMLKARESLEEQGVLSKRQLADELFKPTHLYIRFKPETTDEYNKLNSDTTLILWDYPLDYRFPEGMTKWRDVEIADDKPNYLYTSVKIGQELPSQNYEVLAELILDEELSADNLAKKTAISAYYALLEQESMKLTGNAPESKSGMAKKMGDWRPSGHIVVYDNYINDTVPVVSVNVRTRNWFKSWSGHTDANGNFSSATKYNGDISYSLRWQYPNNRFDIRSGLTGQAFYDGPSQSRSPWNLEISSGLSWFWASIFKAGSYYVGQEPFGLKDIPFDLISIQATDENVEDYNGAYNCVYENISIYRRNSDGSARTSKELFQTTIHELAHAHHDEIYDRAFWDLPSNLMQPWAYAVAYYMANSIYNLKIYAIENRTYQEWMIGGDENSPLMIDMVDTWNQRLSNAGALQDYISGYSLQQIETIVAKGGCKAIVDFANEIKVLPLPKGITNVMLDDYFNQYNGIASPSYNGTVILGGTDLIRSQLYYSPNGRFGLIWQTDGNLVLYDTHVSPWRDVWTSNTWNRTTTQCIMQTDGNLVIYDRINGRPEVSYNVWCSGTWGKNGAVLSVKDNGRVVISSASGTEYWSSTEDKSLLF